MSGAKQEAVRKKVLVVDDDDMFRGVLTKLLVDTGYEVIQANSGKAAQHLLDLAGVHLVISDICMPDGDGIELLKFVRAQDPGVPVVLMTGFGAIPEVQEAADSGAAHFLPKPFKKADLNELLARIFPPVPVTAKNLEESDEDECRAQDRDFEKVGIDEFATGRKIQHDIYVRLRSNRYVKVAHEGEDLDLARVAVYRSKGVMHLYLKREDFIRYAGTTLKLSAAIRKATTIDVQRRLAFLGHASEVVQQCVYVEGVDREFFKQAAEVVHSTIAIALESSPLEGLLQSFSKHSDHLYAHCLGVGVYSVIVGRAMEWVSTTNLNKLALAGMLHDIGLKEIDRNIIDRPRLSWTPEEVREYETHPRRGAEALSRISDLPEDVLTVTLQHHEDGQGNGFPARLMRSHIHPMARLVAVADEFCKNAIANPDSENGMPAEEALSRIKLVSGARFDPRMLEALERVVRPGLAPALAGKAS